MKNLVWLLKWILKAAIFFTLFAFALNNQHEGAVRFFFGTEWRAPMVLVVLAAFCAARAVDLDQLGITACLAFIPAVAMAQTVPISLGGLGIREGALVLFLHPLGVSTGRAVAIGLLVYGLNLAVSLFGAPSFALGGRRAKVTA